MSKDYKEKIRKLLALAQSNNESEAMSALLKARELMAQHKLTESDCLEVKNKKVRTIISKYHYTTRYSGWRSPLAQIISDHYCCSTYVSTIYGKQERRICFVGLEDDVELCVEIFEYAVDEVESQLKRLKSLKDRTILDGYAYGFVVGLKEAYDNQDASEEGWGLVLQTPEEVQQHLKTMNFKKDGKHKGHTLNKNHYNRGAEDGRAFNPNGRINQRYAELA